MGHFGPVYRAQFEPRCDETLDRLRWEAGAPQGTVAPASALYVYDLKTNVRGRFVLKAGALHTA